MMLLEEPDMALPNYWLSPAVCDGGSDPHSCWIRCGQDYPATTRWSKQGQIGPANTGQIEQLCHVVAVVTINYSLFIDVKSHLYLSCRKNP